MDKSLTPQRWLRGHFGQLVSDDVSGADGQEGGVPGNRPDLVGDVGGIAVAVAEFLGRLHELPTHDFPFDTGWETIAARVAASDCQASELPEPYCRYELAELRRIWTEGRPAVDDLVVCHGRPDLGDMRFSDGALVDVGNVDRLCVADRHLDLAIAQQSLQQALGPESVFVFYDTYPHQPDLVRLDHYVLASLLGG